MESCVSPVSTSSISLCRMPLPAQRHRREHPAARAGAARVHEGDPENKLDMLIQLHTALPPGKIGLAPEPVLNNRQISYPFGPNAGITEILVPASYVRTARPEIRARRRQRTQVLPRRHGDTAHRDSAAGSAVLDQFPGRARNGASGTEGRHCLSSGLRTPGAAADVCCACKESHNQGAVSRSRPVQHPGASYFPACSKYCKSGGFWPLRTGIRKPLPRK
jgi:hypothetical protein